MPKAKRPRAITLSKTKKKGHVRKDFMISQIRECLDKYSNIYVIITHNMRSSVTKQLRKEMIDSRFFFGKNKVMAVALGRTAADEQRENLHLLSNQISGNCCLLFTNKEKEEVTRFINSYHGREYPLPGYEPMDTISLSTGPLPQFSHALEPYLRKLGLHTILDNGVIQLLKSYDLCKIGEPITAEKAKLLKLFGHQIAEFYMTVKCRWFDDTFEIL